MEKTKSRNLFLTCAMALAVMFITVFGLAACGEKPLTEENVVGTYEVTNASYTPSEGNTYNTEPATCTKAEYNAIAAKVEAGQELTQEESYKYYEVFDGFFEKYEVKPDHNIHVIGSLYDVQATWKIENGKIIYTEVQQGTYPLSGWSYDAAWDNGKIIITVTVPDGPGATLAGTIVFTLEKIALQ